MKSWEPRSRRAEGSDGSKLLQPCLVQSLAVWRRESHCLHLSVSLQTAQTSSPARGLSPAPPCLPCGAPWQPVITALWQDPEAAVPALKGGSSFSRQRGGRAALANYGAVYQHSKVSIWLRGDPRWFLFCFHWMPISHWSGHPRIAPRLLLPGRLQGCLRTLKWNHRNFSLRLSALPSRAQPLTPRAASSASSVKGLTVIPLGASGR